MQFLHFLLNLLVLTPLSAVLFFLSFFCAYTFLCITPGNEMFFGQEVGQDLMTGIPVFIITLGGIILVSWIIRLIRFGRYSTNKLNFFADIILAPIRLPLMVIVDLLSFLGLFFGWDFDPRNEPSIKYDGWISSILIYTLMIDCQISKRVSKSTSGRTPFSFKRETSTNDAHSFASESVDEKATLVYKVKTIFYQLFVWLLTMFHSIPMIYFVFWVSPKYTYDTLWIILVPIIYVFLYIITTGFSAKLKGIEVTWYTGFKKQKMVWDESISDWKKDPYSQPEEIHGITIMLWLYLLTSFLWFIPQALVVIITALSPSGKCKIASDVDMQYESNFSKKKLVYIFTGIILD